MKVDKNMPAVLAMHPAPLGHDADTVPQEGIAGQDDGVVWRHAVAADRLLITQDLDFSDARKYQPGTHPGILLVRLKKPSRQNLINRVTAFSDASLGDLARCVAVATEVKVRVLRPK